MPPLDQTARISERDARLIAALILKAVNLPCGEAFNIGGPDGVIVARSAAGKLWVGSGDINWYVRWWRKGDPHGTLVEACRAHLDVTQAGYFARRFREACEWTLSQPSHKVSGIGRQQVSRL